jgi:hypothetical protein
LLGDGGERGAGLFGFDDDDGDAIDEQEVIARASFERHFADGNAGSGGEIEGFVILEYPTAGGELCELLPLVSSQIPGPIRGEW